MVSRQIAKQYLKDTKLNGLRHLADTGFFADRFRTEVLEQNVLPWLYAETEKYVRQLDEVIKLPDDFVKVLVLEDEALHAETVEAEC